MDYIADSDSDNSLPLLLASDVDRDLLREVYTFFSESTRQRLRQEAAGTAFALLYDDISDTNAGFGNLQLHPHNQTVPPLDHSITEVTPTDTQAIAALALRARNTTRSFRRRTFTSVHPYIADQADWLGLCSIDSINEMFTGDDDIAKVVRALNQLYLKKRKRYPDDDLYRSKNFYVHLGKSKLIAIAGDPDATDANQQDSLQALLPVGTQEADYDPEDQEDEEGEEDLIPYEGLTENSKEAPSSNWQDSYDRENSDSSDSSESEESDEEKEQLIRIGGRYRKLSSILKGVLPESAKRLGLFQHQEPKKKRKRKAARELIPRKGLAIRKYGTSSAQSAQLEQELNNPSVSDEEEHSRAVTRMHQPTIADAPLRLVPGITRLMSELDCRLESPEIQTILSASDDDSDNVDEILPQGARFANASKSYQKQGSLHFDTAEDIYEIPESDPIDYMFASPSARKNKKSSSGLKAGGPLGRNRVVVASNGRSPNPSGLRTQRSPAAQTQKPRSNPVSQRRPVRDITNYPTLKRRKYTTKNTSRQPAQQSLNIGEPSRKGTPVSAVERSKRVKSKPLQNAISAEPIKHPFKRNPIISTAICEVESTKGPGASTTFFSSIPQHFNPTRESLFVTDLAEGGNSLFGYEGAHRIAIIGDGHIFFPGMDAVMFTMLGKAYHFSVLLGDTSTATSVTFLAHLRRSLSDYSILSRADQRNEIHEALRGFMKWQLIYRQRSQDQIWNLVFGTLNDFTKLQTLEMRHFQLSFYSQILFLLWIMIRFEVSVTSSSRESELLVHLDKFATDYWVLLYQTCSASEISLAASEQVGSPNKKLYESILLIYLIYKDRQQLWWPQLVEAIGEVIELDDTDQSLLDVSYILAAMVPLSRHNWSPFIALFGKFKTRKTAELHHRILDVFEHLNQRLGWPLEERVVTQVYAFFASKKFGNFSDETSVPRPISLLRVRSDLEESSVFDRFLVMTYTFVGELLTKRDVKKLISKLVASSQYQYQKGRKSQIMFVNRMNLILMLSQVSDVDLGNQFTNLINQVKEAQDMFVYGRCMDGLEVISEIAKLKGNPIPLKSFEVLYSAFCDGYAKLFGMPDLLRRFIEFTGTAFQDNGRAFELLKLFSCLNLNAIPDKLQATTFGLMTLAVHRLSLESRVLGSANMRTIEEFQKVILSVLSTQMGRMPIFNQGTDQIIEETIEMLIQIWNMTSRVTGTQHWNMMMLQKYPYIGNAILRKRFVLFFCLEYMRTGDVSDFVLNEMDRILLRELYSSSISKYALDLFLMLTKQQKSMFATRHIVGQENISQSTFQTFRFQIVSSIIQTYLTTAKHPSGAKSAFVRDLVEHLHGELTSNPNIPAFVDMCKRLIELVQRNAKDVTTDIDEFWELSSKLGFPNKRMQMAWSNASEGERLQMLNNEFLSSLQYDQDYRRAIDTWITADDCEVLYSLIQVYISAILVSDAHWAHLSYLLESLSCKLSKFQIPTNQIAFCKLLEMLVDVSKLSWRWVNSSYILFELKAIQACFAIYTQAYYIYSGYKDQAGLIELAADFVTNLDIEPPTNFEPRSIFSDITFGKLRSASHLTYHPKFQHSGEDYSIAYSVQDAHLVAFKLLIDHSKDDDIEELDFTF